MTVAWYVQGKEESSARPTANMYLAEKNKLKGPLYGVFLFREEENIVKTMSHPEKGRKVS